MYQTLKTVLNCQCLQMTAAFGKSGGNLQHNASLVQNYFNKFHDWCDTWGFKNSKTKTTAVIFSKKNDLESLIRMRIGDEDIRFESTVKFLGVIFDKRLTWTNHFNYIIDRCNKRLNLLRALSGRKQGNIVALIPDSNSTHYRLRSHCI